MVMVDTKGRPLDIGDKVKVAGRRGEYTVKWLNPEKNEVTVYGGTRSGVRMYRTVWPEKVTWVGA